MKVIGKINKYYVDKNNGNKHYNYYLIQFDDGHIAEVEYRALRHGKIKNPYIPSVCGVGYIGYGIYNSGTNKRHTKEYDLWKSMLQRCYDDRYQILEPTYIGVIVDERWHNFQNFCEDIKDLKNYKFWLSEDGYELDKDVLCRKNDINPKIYSKNTCLFLKKKYNSIANGIGEIQEKIAIRISDRYEEKFLCIEDFAKKWSLNASCISACLHGRCKEHMGWIFKSGGKVDERKYV